MVRPHCARWGTSFPPQNGAEPPIFGPFLLSPNGWVNQDGTWHGGGPWSRPHCARWGTSSPSQKGAEPPICGPFLLSPNGRMNQDGTWQGGVAWSKPHCVRWGPSHPQFSAHFYCRQTAGCIKMPLGMEVDLSPGDFVLDGDPASLPK